jgi:hypothetical protein
MTLSAGGHDELWGQMQDDSVWCDAVRCDSRDQGSDAFDSPVIEEVHCLSAGVRW